MHRKKANAYPFIIAANDKPDKYYAYDTRKYVCEVFLNYVPYYFDVITSILIKSKHQPSPIHLNPYTGKLLHWKKFGDLYVVNLLSDLCHDDNIKCDPINICIWYNVPLPPIDENATVYVTGLFLDSALSNRSIVLKSMRFKPSYTIINSIGLMSNSSEYYQKYSTKKQPNLNLSDDRIKRKYVDVVKLFIPTVSICVLICDYISPVVVNICEGELYKTHTEMIHINDSFDNSTKNILCKKMQYLASISIFPMQKDAYFKVSDHNKLNSHIVFKSHNIDLCSICGDDASNAINIHRMLFGWNILQDDDILQYTLILSGDNEHIYDSHAYGALCTERAPAVVVNYISNVADSYKIVFRGY